MTKILLIDDERPTLAMFKLLLGIMGYDVVVADNGAEGVETFLRERPDVVLTDVKMPGLDGLEVLRRIKAADRGAKVILVTGHGDVDLAVSALSLDASDFLNKPIQRRALEQALARALARRPDEETGSLPPGEERREGFAVLTVHGRLDGRCEPKMCEALARAMADKARGLVVHFDSRADLDGPGLAALGRLLEQARLGHLPAAVSGLPKDQRQTFLNLGLGRLATLHPDQDQAIASLG